MHPNEIKIALKSLFKFLTEEDLEFLSKANEDINVLITRVLDNNYKPITIEIKDIELKRTAACLYKKDLNYPELFFNKSFYEENIPEGYVENLRAKAHALHDEAAALINKGASNRAFAVEYCIEADKKRELANSINREAALIIMNLSLTNRYKNPEYVSKHKKNGVIDLHGLYKQEALNFIDDLYQKWNFDEINLVTGSKMKNRTLRPAIEEWFEKNKFSWIDLGALIKGKKK